MYIILSIPFCLMGQSKKFPDKNDLTLVYTQAIGDFIKAANQKNKKVFDTLYFGKMVSESGAFPDIKLPGIIESTIVKLITPEAGEKSQKEHPSRIYVNMPGWVDKAGAEFLFFVFSEGFKHQYNYTLKYNYNSHLGKFELIKTEFKGPPFE